MTRRGSTSRDAEAGFELGERLRWSRRADPYRREPGDPTSRRLRIFALDPAASRLDGAVAEVPVPYEPLEPGPCGTIVSVVDRDDSVKDDDDAAVVYRPVDLEDPRLLITSGFDPSPTEWRSHQQMVYAVAMRLYDTFRLALGRAPSWAFDAARLRLRPHADRDLNAWYSRDDGEVAFGYFRRSDNPDIDPAGGPDEWIFTCLSHDIVSHELSHALLDGLRTHFLEPTGIDVLGFHEGFSDIVALLHRFTHRDVVRRAMAQMRGDLGGRSVLSMVARQFGDALGFDGALRHAVDDLATGFATPKKYHDSLEEHDLGEVLLTAVFEAFARIYERRTRALIRLATGGTAVLPAGDIPHDLVESLTDEATAIARQFLNICIRAIDYCPPVDLELGEFLRAMITADRDLVPDDPWGYRETLIAAFRRRGIFPRGVPTLSEDALLWRPCMLEEATIPGLDFGSLRFAGDPGRPASSRELIRQASLMGAFMSDPAHAEAFNLVAPGVRSAGRLGRVRVQRPVVESIRAARRVASNGSIAFDLVGEVIQTATASVTIRRKAHRITLYGGATVIIGADGAVRYAIAKRVTNPERMKRQIAFVRREIASGRGIWSIERSGEIRPSRCPLRIVHRR